MKETCQHIRDLLSQSQQEPLNPADIGQMNDHLVICSECRSFRDALRADSHLLERYARMMEMRLDQIEGQVIKALKKEPRQKQRPVRLPVKLAAWAAMVALVLAGIWVFQQYAVPEPSPPSPELIVRQSEPESDSGSGVAPVDLLAREFEAIEAMIASGDIDGLVRMLAQAQWDSKILTANGLALIGDERALQPLASVSPEWTGDGSINPFDQAIAAIQTRLATPAVALMDTNDVLPHFVEQAQVLEAPVVDPNALCGIVIDRAGAAIANARVVLHLEHTHWGFGNYQVAEALSDANGFYCFPENVGLETLAQHRFAMNRFMLLASHPDYALGWSLIPTQSLVGFYDITLTEPVTRSVQVLDINDTPIAGAWVWPYSLGDQESPDLVFRDYLFLSTDSGLVGGITDQEGWAKITHLPDTDLAYRATLAGHSEGLTFHAGHPIRLNPGGTVKGRVLSEQGQGIQDAMVVFYSDWGHHGYWLAQTDAVGDFVLEDLPTRGWDRTPWGNTEGGNGAYIVTLEHPEVIMPQTRVTLEPGQVIEDWTLTAHADTVLLKCLVLAVDTNEPVAGADVRVGLNPMGETSGNTDANGVFTCRVLPGETSLWTRSPPEGFYTLPEQNPSESYQRFQASGSQMQVTLKSAPLAGTLISVQGTIMHLGEIQVEGAVKVHAAAEKRFRTATAMNYIRSVSCEPSGLFELNEVPAGLDLYVYAESQNRRFAAIGEYVIDHEPNEAPFLELDLLPTETATITVTDKQGLLACSLDVSFEPVVQGQNIWRAERQGRTNEQGELVMDGILPGVTYKIYDEAGSEKLRKEGEQVVDIQQVLISLVD